MAKPAALELIDIIPPITPAPAPPPYGWIFVGVALVLVLAFSAALFWRRRHRDRLSARAQLKQTERALQQGRLGPRAAAFQVAHALRRAGQSGFARVKVDNTQALFRTLDEACYARQAPSVQHSMQLLMLTRERLRHSSC